MSPEDRARFARQISLPEIGLAGQKRIGAARFSIAGLDPRVARSAEDHAIRAGARKGETGSALTAAADVANLAGRPELEECAAFLLGALAALELVRGAVLPPSARTIRPVVLA